MEKKVNLFIVGVNKCGTTTLHNILNTHEKIFMSKEKEPHFFSSEFLKGKCTNLEPIYKNYSKYLKLFDFNGNYKYFGESSTSYINFSQVAEKIYNYNNKAKIIVIIRNPIQRALSQWKMDYGNGWTDKDFLEVFWEDYKKKNKTICNSSMYYEFGLYYEKILSYKKVFGDSLLVLIQEEMKNNLEKILEEISCFLEVENSYFILDDKYNVSGIPKNKFYKLIYQNFFIRKVLGKFLSSQMKNKLKKKILNKFDYQLSDEDLNKIKKLYIEDIEKLANLLEKDLKSLWKI